MSIELLMARYGLPAIFLGAAIEGETVVMTGGLLAHQHLLTLPGVMIAAAAGSFCADQGLFLVGRHFRTRPAVARIMAKPAFAAALARLESHPTAFIFAFRFLYGMRTISPLAIGTSHVPVRTFALLNALAAMIWGIVMAFVGYAFGHGVELLFGKLRHAEHLLMAVAGLALASAAVILSVRWRQRAAAVTSQSGR